MNETFIVVFSFVFSFLGTMAVRRIALRKSLLDIPGKRSSHTVPTPRGGGIAIGLSWFTGISMLFLTGKIPDTLFYSLLFGIPIFLTGFIDDIVNVSPGIRLVIQCLSALGAFWILGGIESVDILGYTIRSAMLLGFFGIIGIIWFTNLFNFLDGIDGYVSAQVIFTGLAVFLLFGFLPPLLLAMAVAGFIIWNWQPAKIFMGDVGSTLLGFTIAIFAIYYHDKLDSSLLVWLMLTSLFWMDATITLFRRWLNKEPLLEAHKKHAYQRIVQAGFSHQKTVLYGLLLNLVILGLVIIGQNYEFYFPLLFFINILLLLAFLKLVDRKKSFK